MLRESEKGRINIINLTFESLSASLVLSFVSIPESMTLKSQHCRIISISRSADAMFQNFLEVASLVLPTVLFVSRYSHLMRVILILDIPVDYFLDKWQNNSSVFLIHKKTSIHVSNPEVNLCHAGNNTDSRYPPPPVESW